MGWRKCKSKVSESENFPWILTNFREIRTKCISMTNTSYANIRKSVKAYNSPTNLDNDIETKRVFNLIFKKRMLLVIENVFIVITDYNYLLVIFNATCRLQAFSEIFPSLEISSDTSFSMTQFFATNRLIII